MEVAATARPVAAELALTSAQLRALAGLMGVTLGAARDRVLALDESVREELLLRMSAR